MLCGTWTLTRFSCRKTQQILPPTEARVNLLDATADGCTFRDLAGSFLFYLLLLLLLERKQGEEEGWEKKQQHLQRVVESH